MQAAASPPLHPFDGAIFDCDGTLADTMPLHLQAWLQALAGTPIRLTEERFYQLGGVPSTEIVRTLNREQDVHLDPDSTAARKEEMYEALLPQVKPIDCIVALAKEYRGKFPMAVASGGIRPIVVRTIEAIGILHYFSVIATSEDVLHGKPAPDLFLYAARQLGVTPSRCIVYEDSPLGLQAAEAAGMIAVDIRTLL